MGRVAGDWIEGFLDYTDGLKSPHIWRKWTAMCVISGALQRRVWVHIEGQDQFANLYVLFVGPPARGKSNAIKTGRNHFLLDIQTIKVTPEDITKAAFYERMEGASQTFRIADESVIQCPIIGFIDEWSVFIKKNDEEFMNFLADVYDNPPKRDYVTKNKGQNALNFPCFTMLGGVTAKQLRERISVEALEGGFASRLIMVYSEEKIKVPTGLKRKGNGGSSEELEGIKSKRAGIRSKLLHDLESIAVLDGEYDWHDDAANEAEAWIARSMAPVPQDPRLAHYCERRTAHFTKLCMVLAASRRDDLVIHSEDVQAAKIFLLEAEETMPKAVSQIGSSEHIDAVRLARKVIEAEFNRTGKPVPEYKLRQELLPEVPIYLVQQVIENMVRAHWATQVGEAHSPLYLPPGATVNR